MKHRYIAAAMGKAMREKAAAEGRLVETKAGIQYALETTTRYMMLAFWSGRGDRPACHYRVRDEAHAMQIVAAMIENAEKAAAEKASYAAAKKAQRTAMADKIQVGSLLVHRWGYDDETSVDFFEVVARKGLTVTMREIASEEVERTGSESVRVRACPGKYIGLTSKKRIKEYGVEMAYGVAIPTTADATHRCS